MRYRSNNILAFIPPTKEGEKILKQTMFFQQVLDMRIFVFNIIEKPSFFEKLLKPKKIIDLKKEALDYQHNFLHKRLPTETASKYSVRVKTGNILKILLSQAKKGGYEFMIIDKSAAIPGLGRYETDKIISRSECPILTVYKDFYVDEIKKIVIPVDISQTTKKKLLWATYFAKKFNAEIKIVSALGLNISSRKSLAWRNAEKLKQMLSERGVKCEVEVIKAKGQEKHLVILDYIRKEAPGMVIIRTHQESNMSGTQIGKFVSELVHDCEIPVFTVNRYLYPMPVDFEI